MESVTQTRLIQPTREETPKQNINQVLSDFTEESALEDMLGIAHEVSLFDCQVRGVAVKDEKFIKLTNKIMEQLSVASNDQLMRIVDAYSRLNCSGAPPDFKRLISKLAIDIKDELLLRDDVTVDSALYFMDFFNHVNRQALTLFMDKFTPVVDSLNKEQCILLLHNFFKEHDLLVKLEEKVEEFFDTCSSQELAVASLGFHRSRYILTSETLVEKLSTRLLNDLDNLTEMTIISMVEIINYSTRNERVYNNPTVWQNMRSVARSLLPRLKDFSPSSCTTLFRISANLYQLNHNLMNALCQKLETSDIDQWRLNDLVWFIFTLCQFQWKMEERHYNNIIKSLGKEEREPEITSNPQELVQALVGLSLVGIYPYNLINEVMSPLFRSKMKDLSRDLYFLDQSVRLEKPSYDGFLLPDNFFEQLPKDHIIFANRLLPHEKKRQSKRDEMLLQIQRSVDLLCGKEMCAKIAFVFRHIHTADIVLKVDENKKPIPIRDWASTDLTIRDGSSQKTIILMLVTGNCYVMYDTVCGYIRELLATHIAKRRQTELLKHTVIEIPYYNWYGRRVKRRQFLIKQMDNLVSFDRTDE